MRVFFRSLICVFLILFLTSSSAVGEERICMRVIAHDDSPVSQTIKWKARSCALIWLRQMDLQDPAMLSSSLQTRLQTAGFPTRVHWVRWSPDVLHAPIPTLRITLGQGRGHNWWGILCTDAQQWSFLQANKKSGSPSDTAPDSYRLIFPLFDRIRALFAFREHQLQIGEVGQ